MTLPSRQEITGLLVAWSEGEQTALEKLTPLVYSELRRVAHRYMARERPGHSLQTTALVNAHGITSSEEVERRRYRSMKLWRYRRRKVKIW